MGFRPQRAERVDEPVPAVAQSRSSDQPRPCACAGGAHGASVASSASAVNARVEVRRRLAQQDREVRRVQRVRPVALLAARRGGDHQRRVALEQVEVARAERAQALARRHARARAAADRRSARSGSRASARRAARTRARRGRRSGGRACRCRRTRRARRPPSRRPRSPARRRAPPPRRGCARGCAPRPPARVERVRLQQGKFHQALDGRLHFAHEVAEQVLQALRELGVGERVAVLGERVVGHADRAARTRARARRRPSAPCAPRPAPRRRRRGRCWRRSRRLGL